MRGHTKIELTNVKTGEVQVIEEDNIVTTLLSEMVPSRLLQLSDSFFLARDRTLSNYDSEDRNRVRTPFTEYGGLLMFKEQLETDVNSYYPKVPVTMTGHASDDTYAGNDRTRGSFNAGLSSYDVKEGRATLVWDFTMEQGNGTIGTVCLCNHVDGKIGYGSNYDVEDTNNAKAPFYHHMNPFVSNATVYGPAFHVKLRREYPDVTTNGFCWYNGYPSFGYVPVWLDTASNKLVMMNISYVAGSSFEFAVIDVDCSSANPLTVIQGSYLSGSESRMLFTPDYRNVEYFDIPLRVTDVSGSTSLFSNEYFASGFDTLKMWAGLDGKGNFWFSPAYRHYKSNISNNTANQYNLVWTAGAKMLFTKLHLSTMETTEYEVTNTTGADITLNMGYDRNKLGYLTSLCELAGYLVIRGDNAHLYAINLDNNSDVHEVTYSDGTPVLVHKYTSTSYSECDGKAYVGSSYNYRRGWLVTTLGDFMIINDSGGRFVHTTDGHMLIVDSNFIARKLSCTRNCFLPDYYTSTSSIMDRNSGNIIIIGDSDTPLCLGLYLNSTNNNSNDNSSATYNYSTSDKCADFSTPLGQYSYKPMGLLTINTLAEPVTKTADMTMRITYTLTA